MESLSNLFILFLELHTSDSHQLETSNSKLETKIQRYPEIAGKESRHGYWSFLLQTESIVQIQVRIRCGVQNRTCGVPDTTIGLFPEALIPGYD